MLFTNTYNIFTVGGSIQKSIGGYTVITLHIQTWHSFKNVMVITITLNLQSLMKLHSQIVIGVNSNTVNENVNVV